MKGLPALVGFLLTSYAAAGIGSLFTRHSLGPWYDGLRKPGWTPSGWIIGLIWSVLYTLMGIAAFLTWRKGDEKLEVRMSLGAYVIQLNLNILWSALFFGLRSPGWALAEIVVLWLSIAEWLRTTARVDRTAAALIAPYLAWVTFAGVLNARIWLLNRK